MKQPNIILVITDDQGYADLECHGNPWLKTPHIDRFAGEAVRLDRFHVGPTCAPTRAGLLTGHYANSTGVWHTIGGRSLMRKDEWTLADALKENGYRTGLFGKWHLGDAHPFLPHERGFETALYHGGGGVGQTPDYWGNDYFDDTYFLNGEPRRYSGYCTDVWFKEAMKWMEEPREAPFFCYLSLNAPHGPYNVDSVYSDRYAGKLSDERARFYGMIDNIDENFGKLRDFLKGKGLEEDTLLIFMTDNGSSGGCKTNDDDFVCDDGYNAGMRGQKGSPYDGGHRVPFFLRWPGGGLPEDVSIEHLAAIVDLMPTLLDLCGIPVPGERAFHGKSLAPILREPGREDWPDRIVVTDSQRVTDPVKWKDSAVMTDRWRLVNGSELYDIQADPGQRENIAERHTETVERLRQGYEEWWALVSRQFESMIPFEIDQEPILLTGLDWRNEASACPWIQGDIRRGKRLNGYWEIDVKRPGRYRVSLRRWPAETPHAIQAGIEGDDIAWEREKVHSIFHFCYTGGEALPIASATLRIGEHTWQNTVTEQDRLSLFNVELPAGQTTLESAFLDAEGHEIAGAYYVEIETL